MGLAHIAGLFSLISCGVQVTVPMRPPSPGGSLDIRYEGVIPACVTVAKDFYRLAVHDALDKLVDS